MIVMCDIIKAPTRNISEGFTRKGVCITGVKQFSHHLSNRWKVRQTIANSLEEWFSMRILHHLVKVGYGKAWNEGWSNYFGTKSCVAFTGNCLGRRKTEEVQFRPDWTHTRTFTSTQTHTRQHATLIHRNVSHLRQAVNKLYSIKTISINSKL